MCNDILQEIKDLHPARWVRRTEMEMYRGVDQADCQYSCALNKGLGKDTLAKLSALAPEIKNAVLTEVVINRYEDGDYIPTHSDRSNKIYNMLIHLEDSEENGLIIKDTFYPDRQGQMVVFKGTGEVHSVPPVKGTRYTLIYLYERAINA